MNNQARCAVCFEVLDLIDGKFPKHGIYGRRACSNSDRSLTEQSDMLSEILGESPVDYYMKELTRD